MEKIYDIRFIVPPVLMGFYIFLFSPQYFFNLLLQYKLVNILPIASILLLALGVIISSAVNSIVVFFDLRSSNYSLDSKKILKDNFMINEDLDNYKSNSTKNALELCSWLVANSVNVDVARRIDNRWNWAMAGFNFIVATIFAILGVLFLNLYLKTIPYDTFGGVAWSLFVITTMALFLYNAIKNLQSVKSLDEILANNYRQLMVSNEKYKLEK